MATRISIVSTKGGVGKTPLTDNLGGILSDLGQRVLLINADIQPTLSRYYRLAHQAPRSLVEVLETCDTADSISVSMSGATSSSRTIPGGGKRPRAGAPLGAHPSRIYPSGLESMLIISVVAELPLGLEDASLSISDVG